MSGARLAHYDGESRITLRFLDHRPGRHEDLELSQKELILRLIKHIPEKHFRMVRYFGFLANRVVGRQLPLVKKALGQDEAAKAKAVTFSTLSEGLLKTDPFSCLLCGAKMAFSRSLAAVPLEKLIADAGEIARMHYMGERGKICQKPSGMVKKRALHSNVAYSPIGCMKKKPIFATGCLPVSGATKSSKFLGVNTAYTTISIL
ncbi:hypothetical protein HJV04_004588 [Escherichia coli]|nr:hypothetical protein [Escherichia coli]